MKILIVVNLEKPEGVKLAREIVDYLKKKNIESEIIEENISERGDFVITIGGDGTFLKGFHIFPDIPLCGIHMGKLGFLAHIDYEEWKEAIDLICDGKYKIIERTLVEMNLKSENFFALNDIVLTNKFPGRLIEYNVILKGEKLNFLSDGLIVSTPTGSTAYNFANYGPVVDENIECIILNSLSPHNISLRPIVVSKFERVKVFLGKKTKRASFWIDGQKEVEFVYNEEAEFFVSKRKCKFLIPSGFDFNLIKRLKEKLKWE
ncbi:MAG: NAD(+)/NADH kinase [candidate division WOR-3 bacterium]